MFCIAVPPSKPVIFDESGREVKDLVGPYLEGETIVLKCITSGGIVTLFPRKPPQTFEFRRENSNYRFWLGISNLKIH